MTEQQPTHTDWEWVKEVLAIKERVAALLAAVEGVLELHAPNSGHNSECQCGIPAGNDARCRACTKLYPCPTVAAINVALEGKP